MGRYWTITIGREYGSGGHEVGELVAKHLGFGFYDKQIINLAAKQSGIAPELFENAEDNRPSPFMADLLVSSYAATGWPIAFDDYSLSGKLFLAQSQVIKQQAERENCVIIGRCADYVLRERENCLNLFVHASLENRIERIMRINEVNEKKARDIIKTIDRRRANYYNYYTNKDWAAAQSYHVCVDSSFIGVDETAKLISEMAKGIMAAK